MSHPTVSKTFKTFSREKKMENFGMFKSDDDIKDCSTKGNKNRPGDTAVKTQRNRVREIKQ